MRRRQCLRAAGACSGILALAGCVETLPGGNAPPDYPGGTLVVENAGDSPVRVSVDTKLEQFDAQLDVEVAGGETVVRREFVTAETGDIVTLEALLGETGERIRFQFLPAGGGEDTPPEVARLTFESGVEASATWTATAGT
ncbi:hypothetical protein [Halorubrum sp. AJ67]|uniref:hypothetical protein n=1 Tax=Halorubrum sp. AJ67 TaxID=1173487 RepID=UPI001E48AFEC|nr:hypothetical protein [Halorubrum sp. AJ67]